MDAETAAQIQKLAERIALLEAVQKAQLEIIRDLVERIEPPVHPPEQPR
jgi:hypothetical protein